MELSVGAVVAVSPHEYMKTTGEQLQDVELLVAAFFAVSLCEYIAALPCRGMDLVYACH